MRKLEIQLIQIYIKFKGFFSDKKLIVPYIMVTGIEIWWSLVYIYVPLFIIKNGLSEMFVGYFLSVVVIPLVLFEFWIGKLSLKYGSRIFFFSGFFLLMVARMLSFFSTDFYFTLFVLGLTPIPMAFLESIHFSLNKFQIMMKKNFILFLQLPKILKVLLERFQLLCFWFL
jgi:hypothetical protein